MLETLIHYNWIFIYSNDDKLYLIYLPLFWRYHHQTHENPYQNDNVALLTVGKIYHSCISLAYLYAISSSVRTSRFMPKFYIGRQPRY